MRDVEPPTVHFEPLRPAWRTRILLGLVLGPFLWLVALIVAAWFFVSTEAIQLGLLVAGVSFVVAFVLLLIIRVGRNREARRYVDSG